MNSAESKIFPTGPVGAARGAPPVEPPQHQTFQRQVVVYIPAGYTPNTPTPFIVVQDGQTYDAGADANPRTDRAFIPPMLDNLIYEKRIPPIVAVLVAPGPGPQRSIEYDTVSDRYTNFVETELLPRVTKDYQVAFTTDPEGRATFGMSSGAAAALTMAWLHPNLYRRVDQLFGNLRRPPAQRHRPERSVGLSPDLHSAIRAQAAADLVSRQRERPRGEFPRRTDAQLGDRQQPDVRGVEGQRISAPVRLFRGLGPRRSASAASDNARSLRVGLERLQADRQMTNMRILAVLAWAGLSFVAAYAQTSRMIAQPGAVILEPPTIWRIGRGVAHPR
jgi:enterochelin esterase-like enzyme